MAQQFELNPLAAADMAAVSAAFDRLAPDELHRLLRQQRRVVEDLHDRWSASRAEHDAADQATPADDPIGVEPEGSSSWPDASDVENTTLTLAAEMIEDVWSTMLIHWLAWWADTAILAVDGGGVVDRIRAVATSPQWLLKPHQVDRLRQRRATAIDDGADEDTGVPESISDPESMRSMLWGRAWTQHQIPTLPNRLRFADLLAAATDPRTAGSVTTKLDRVREAVAAGERAREHLSNTGHRKPTPQVAALWGLYDERHAALHALAAGITTALTR